MASIVFFRAVNVGGHQTFQPGVLAKQLADFDVVNVGAAGTFVVRGTVGARTLRDEIHRRLPFKPELMICPARDIVDLAHREPFRDRSTGKDIGRFISVMQRVPSRVARLPIEQPAGDPWEVRIVALSGRFALSLRRSQGKAIVYPNAVVEKYFGVSATTRNWNTFVAIQKILET